ncbi:hypothetical protein DW1_2501 [Proteiniborus sp. DW1]|nr:hypothetical protein DW1_2501 [Proteiniborus sp. DW1]
MKKLLVLIMALIVTLSLVACRGEDIQEAEETIADPSANSTDAVDLPYQNVTPEQIQTLSDVLAELEPLYNEAAALAVENGWEADEITVQELNVVYTLIDAGKHGVADPSEYGDTSKEDMDVLVEQYQAILGAMPDLIAKVSELYEE